MIRPVAIPTEALDPRFLVYYFTNATGISDGDSKPRLLFVTFPIISPNGKNMNKFQERCTSNACLELRSLDPFSLSLLLAFEL